MAASEEHDLLQSQLSEVLSSWNESQEANKQLKRVQDSLKTKCKVLENEKKEMSRKVNRRSTSPPTINKMNSFRSQRSFDTASSKSVQRSKSADRIRRRPGNSKMFKKNKKTSTYVEVEQDQTVRQTMAQIHPKLHILRYDLEEYLNSSNTKYPSGQQSEKKARNASSPI
mmetsp:Transcript_9369/g.12222  ORF Transcript_9369/g.12222 Transcript_9369/m.12222 type:complete len:170 (+) Transcript_9369:2-511(+)